MKVAQAGDEFGSRAWAPVPGWPKYEVSDHGDVRRIDTGHMLKPVVASSRYAHVRLSIDGIAKTFSIHRLVLLAFVGPRGAGQQTRHLDGDAKNNKLSNLKYGTAKENAEDKFRHGTVLRGVAHGMATVSDDAAVEAIVRARTTSLKAEAERLGIAQSTLSMIRRGVNRPHLFDRIRQFCQ